MHTLPTKVRLYSTNYLIYFIPSFQKHLSKVAIVCSNSLLTLPITRNQSRFSRPQSSQLRILSPFFTNHPVKALISFQLRRTQPGDPVSSSPFPSLPRPDGLDFSARPFLRGHNIELRGSMTPSMDRPGQKSWYQGIGAVGLGTLALGKRGGAC